MRPVSSSTFLRAHVLHLSPRAQDGVEELFDIVSCYFPISFTPPPDNPHGLTRETLAASLADTLVATPLFLPFLMPLLEEKLASSHK